MSIQSLAEKVGAHLLKNQLILATAESCTGGWVAQAITSIPGSSLFFERGFVTYTNESKIDMLDVPEAVIQDLGAVSESTVIAMANGAIKNSRANVSIAISGIAGPDGGTEEKPVGTVWIAWGQKNSEAIAKKFHFEGDRMAIREAAVLQALTGLLSLTSLTGTK